jgi:hypothetical protein
MWGHTRTAVMVRVTTTIVSGKCGSGIGDEDCIECGAIHRVV